MNVSTFINKTYLAYRGKGASKVPVFGTEKSNNILSIANDKKDEWARDPNQNWASNFKSMLTSINEPGTVTTAGTTALVGTDTYFTDYQVGDKIIVNGETERTIDTITSDTSLTVSVAFSNTTTTTFKHKTIISSAKEYSLHRGLLTPAGKVQVIVGVNTYDYTIETPNARESGDVYISSNNPKKITFYNDINPAIIGGELIVAGYYAPEDMVLETDLIKVDDPNWLIDITASELARNDPAKEDQFANLLGRANESYRKMILSNMNLGYLQNNSIPNNMPQIGSCEDDWTL